MFSFVNILILFTVAWSAPLVRQPNIIIIIADDLGWNDVSFNGSPDISTPHLDELAADGVILKNYYVQQVCTPSRAALLSGTYPIVNGLCTGPIIPMQRIGIPLNMPTLAEKLRDLGYATHMIGKWHVGHFEYAYLPIHRGFDTYLGCTQALTDQFTHSSFIRFQTGAGYTTKFEGHDFLDGDIPVFDYDGQHTTDVFTARLIKLLEKHMSTTPTKPFFFDLSFTAPHSPLQAPERFIQQYSTMADQNRREYAAMISQLDEGIGNITKAIKSYSGLWENTIIIFTTDNGGSDSMGGNNFPLRGNKGSLLEGGVRGVGLVVSELIDKKYRNTTNHAWLHITDWYPTLVTLAGGNITGQSLNGFDVWNSIATNTSSPRTELLININNQRRGSERPGSPFDVRLTAGLRIGNWKLLTGNGGVGVWYNTPNSIPNVTINSRNPNSVEITPGSSQSRPGYIIRQSNDNSTKNVWLFDIDNDPNEYTDLSNIYPDRVDSMLQRLAYYYTNVMRAGGCSSTGADLLSDPCFNQGNFLPWVTNNQPPPQYN